MNSEGGEKMSVITISKDNFDSEVLRSDKPVLIDFWAAWCGPCRMIAPIVEQIAEEVSGIQVGKIDVDDQPELARQFGVMSIPTLILFQNGKVVKQMTGVQPKPAIMDAIQSALG